MNYDITSRFPAHSRLFLTGFIFCSVLFILTIVALTKHFVDAQIADQALEVSPPSQEITVDPGDSVTVTTTIRNSSNTTLPFTVQIHDFTAEGDEGQVAIAEKSNYSVASWTTVSPESFSLSPGEEQEVTGIIKVPSDAAGGRYGSFVFSVKGDEEGGSASVTQQIASLFLVRINGPVDETLNLISFQAPNFSEFGPIPFNLTFENKGNVHVKVYGLVNVSDMFGNTVADIVVPGTNVFPQAERVVTTSLNKKFLVGPYTATAIMYYGTATNDTLTQTASFFVFPTRIAIGVIVVLFVLFLMRKRIGKSLRALFRG